MKINSVKGPIDTSELGCTLMHEHILSVSRALAYAFPGWIDENQVVETFKKDMDSIKPLGMQTFVDASTICNGRDVLVDIKASEASGVNILMVTGLYWPERPWYSMNPKVGIPTIDEKFLASLFIKELTEGIQGTDVKAAMVKCATDTVHGFSPANISMIRACGRAAIETGAPVTAHSDARTRQGLVQQKILTELGVPSHRILLNHSFSTDDLEYIQELMDGGSYVGCDQIGFDALEVPIATLAKNLAYFIRKGYGKHIVLSHDKCLCNDYGIGLSYLHRSEEDPMIGHYQEVFHVLPGLLINEGVSQAEIDMLLIDNPRRYFEGGAL